jgi:hypothetical protein
MYTVLVDSGQILMRIFSEPQSVLKGILFVDILLSGKIHMPASDPYTPLPLFIVDM